MRTVFYLSIITGIGGFFGGRLNFRGGNGPFSGRRGGVLFWGSVVVLGMLIFWGEKRSFAGWIRQFILRISGIRQDTRWKILIS